MHLQNHAANATYGTAAEESNITTSREGRLVGSDARHR